MARPIAPRGPSSAQMVRNALLQCKVSTQGVDQFLAANPVTSADDRLLILDLLTRLVVDPTGRGGGGGGGGGYK